MSDKNNDQIKDPFSAKINENQHYDHFLPRNGESLGKLQIVERIGQGAVGTVYKVHNKDFETIRAIKILNPDYTEERKNRFEMEIKISAALKHPNIITVYSADSWNGLPFFEMEHVDGCSVADLISQYERVPVPVAIAIIATVAKALDYASQHTYGFQGQVIKGLVHRDIKPANILLSNSGDIKIADFGLARLGNVSLHTSDGSVVGTEMYLSPELLNEDSPSIRSDIYALGMVLFEMICGVRPFPENSIKKMIFAKENEATPELKQFVENPPKELVNIISRCLRKDPKKRYRKYGHLQKACESLLYCMGEKKSEQLIEDYSKNPHKPEIKSIPTIKRRKFPVYTTVIFVSILVVTTLSFVILLSNVNKKNRTKLIDDTLDYHLTLEDILQNNDSLNTKVEKSIDSFKKIEYTNSLKEQGVKKSVLSKKKKRKKAKASVKEKSNKSTITDLISDKEQSSIGYAYDLVKRGLYGAAFVRLSTLDFTTLSPTSKDSAIGLMVRTLFGKGDIASALTFANENKSDDCYYYLVMAEVYTVLNKHEKVKEMLDKSINTSSVFGANAKKNAYYKRAVFLKDEYKAVRSENAKVAMIASWKEFKKFWCYQPSMQCKEV